MSTRPPTIEERLEELVDALNRLSAGQARLTEAVQCLGAAMLAVLARLDRKRWWKW